MSDVGAGLTAVCQEGLDEAGDVRITDQPMNIKLLVI